MGKEERKEMKMGRYGRSMTQHSWAYYFNPWGWVRLSPLGTSATNWPIVPAPDDRWVWCILWDVNCQGKQECSEETYPNAALSPKNRTGPDLRSNPPVHRGRKPATDSLIYGASFYDCDSFIKLPAGGRVLEKVTAAELFKKCPEIKAHRVFITVFTKARHWFLYWARWIQSTLSHSF
jgi:hypothetical protein